MKFDGFLTLYQEGEDETAEDEESRRLPAMAQDETLAKEAIEAAQHFTEPPPRFSEAALVKRMEELGIGRPSTYASILQVLQDRGYVRIDKKRLIPEDKGRVVVGFLESFFKRYVEYDFTAALEEQLDRVSNNEIDWKKVLEDFWTDFIGAVDEIKEVRNRVVLDALNDLLEPHIFPARADGGDVRQCPQCGTGELSLKVGRFGAFIGCSNYPDCTFTRQMTPGANGNQPTKVLGTDPVTGLDVTIRGGRFGTYLQLGEEIKAEKLKKGEKDPDAPSRKPKRASLPKGVEPDDIDLDKALALLALPREVGKSPEDGEPILAGVGRFGPYVKHGKVYASLEDGDDVLTVGLNRAMHLIADKIANPKKGRRFGADPGKVLGEHPDKGGPIVVKNGRYGPYVSHNGVNATLTGDKTPETVTLDEAIVLLDARAAAMGNSPKGRRAAGRKTGLRQGGGLARRPSRRSRPPPKQRSRPRSPPRQSPRAAPRRRRRIAGEASFQSLHSLSISAVIGAGIFILNKQSKRTPSLPSKADILAFIGKRPGKVGTREIARAFGLKNAMRAELKRMLRELADEGAVEKRHKKLHHPGTLPSTVLADITARDTDGDLIATPDEWDEEAHGPAPKIRIPIPRKTRPGEAAGIGDRVLLHVEETEEDDGIRHRGRVIKIIDHPKQRVLGIFRKAPQAAAGWSRSTRRCSARSSAFPRAPPREAEDGDLVAVETSRAPRLGLPTARVVERLGSLESERAVSLIAIHAHSIPQVFRPDTLRRSGSRQAGDARRPRGLAARAVRHHRSARRQGSRRRRACRARHGRQQSRRLHPHRRHRRRRPLRDARLGARPRSAGARQFGLFPRPRGADAAGAHFQRSVLAAPARGPRRARRAHGDRRRRPQALAHVPPHHDALGGEALLPADAIRHRRPHRRGHRRRWSSRCSSRSTPPTKRSNARAPSAGRSISICPNARSCSRTTAPSTASSRRSGWRRTG